VVQTLIPSDTWPSIELSDGDKGEVVAAVSSGGRWSGVMFDRASVVRAFPGDNRHNAAVAEADSAIEIKRDWQPRPGESLKAWVGREEVDTEAKERLAGGKTGKQSINGVMGLMAEEAHVKWAQKSIAEARRLSGRNPSSI
jgi:hypothetical protein